MNSKRYKSLGSLADLPEGRLTARKIGSKEFLLLRRGDRVFISGNKCPHHGARLSEGLAFGREVICPCHNARFDMESGRVLCPPALDDIPVYHSGRQGEEVLVGPVRENRGLCLPSMAAPRGRRSKTIVIVGAGAAGNAAADALRREGFAGKVLMLTRESDLPYDRTLLSKGFLSGNVTAEQLPLRSPEYYAAMGIEVLTSCTVDSLEPKERRVVLENGRSIGYDKLLLATGGAPRRLDVPGAGLPGAHYLRSRSDAAAILESLPSVDKVVITGAGFIGLEVASALRKRGIAVRVVAPEKVPLTAAVGEEVGRWLQDLHAAAGVGFFLGRGIREISGSGRVEEVVLSDGSSYETDLVVIGVGIEPAVEYLRTTTLVRNGAVPVDSRLRTELPDIYAAGDLAVVKGPDGRITRIEHWVEAERQGRLAALSMLGRGADPESVPFFWSEQQEVTLKCVGVPHPAHRRIVRGNLEEERFLMGFFNGCALEAAVAVGRDRDLIAASRLIGNAVLLTPERFCDESTDLAALASDR